MSGWSINPEYKDLPGEIKSHHDIKTTQETIKKLLAGGTPDWVSHPEDYRAYAQEAQLAEKEISDNLVSQYRMEDQDLLIDAKARFVNIMPTHIFAQKLTNAGIKNFAMDSGMAGTVGLWVVRSGMSGFEAKYICYIQVPAMIEWSILRLDDHGLPNGEHYRGWRTVVSQLILKGILTEKRAHEIFGRPTDSIVSRKYRQRLYEYRHRFGSNEQTEF